jgi:hypothetical protein
LWKWALVTVLRVEPIIDVALEVACAMKPRTSADEAIPVKPFRTIVAGGCTVIWGDVVVAIRTFRGYPDFDADLSLCFWGGSGEADCSNSSSE